MSARRTSFGKVERERAKKNKAAAKREQRFGRAGPEDSMEEPEPAAALSVADETSTADLLARIEELHQRFDAGVIEYDDFETQKADLMSRLRLD